MPPFQPPPISLQPLLDLLGVLPFLLPPRIRNLLPMECNEGTLPWKYSLDALSYLVHNGILPGTSSTSMDHTYEWPLDWTPRDFKGNDVIGMANHLRSLYPHHRSWSHVHQAPYSCSPRSRWTLRLPTPFHYLGPHRGPHFTLRPEHIWLRQNFFFLLYAAWVRSRAERPSVSYTKVVMEVAWTGHNLQFTKTN